MQTTRRSMLGVMVALPAAALPALPALALGPTAWSKALARYRAADAAWDHYNASVWNPAIDHIDRVAPMPKLSWTITARSGQTATYHFNSSDPDQWDDVWGPCGEAGRKAKVEYQAWRARYGELSRELDLDGLEARAEVFCEATLAARTDAIAAPAASMREALQKAEFIDELSAGERVDEEHFAALLSDLRRLASGGIT